MKKIDPVEGSVHPITAFYSKINELVDAVNLLSDDKPCKTPEKDELAELLRDASYHYQCGAKLMTSGESKAVANEARKWMREKIGNRRYIEIEELLKRIGG